MNYNILLSIIIPTKNRQIYLFKVLEIINEYKLDNIEVVIQDNSDDKSILSNFIENDFNKSLNIKYFYSDKNLSQGGNAELAVSNSRGEYICFIGDDDCFTKDIVNAVSWMKENNIEVLITKKPNYSWSDLKHKNLGNNFSGLLKTYRYSGEHVWKDSIVELKKCLKSGGQNILELPQFYHNIVKRDVLEKVFVKAGSYFPGPSPDMAIAIALTSVVNRYVKIDYPIVISGKASGSVGGLGAKGLHFGEIKDIKMLPSNTAETWSDGVPFYWSGATIYADSLFKSLKATGNENLISKFNYNYLYATCFVYDVNYRDRIIKSFFANKKSSIFLILYSFFLVWLNRFIVYFSNRVLIFFPTKILYYSNIFELKDALLLIEQNNSKINAPWK
jgi:glycosyltransferase involved in cell wall biosynthesis